MSDTTAIDPRLSRMKRRLRKKLYLGEFQELAFELKADFKQTLEDPELDAFLEAFIDFIESRDLDYVGGFGETWIEGTIMASKRYHSPSEEDRQVLTDWLKARSEVASATASDLYDAWHY
ncbi:hypothetical protein IQ22_02366 [Pseudomonas duriflava]|uniref:DUF469 domain-containing protein n=1 Tax=Pseudomonas duriflava TaxID=459528 RepID=A0A562QAL9_9PSED|nr:YggL family protein [Pseudomonas duriflava]TWI53759.1 hypothetical protein IQ22_02366 [Pseudomonas duriflava]